MHQDYIKGVKGAIPIVLGYMPIGMAFGILAVQQGLSVYDIFLMSLLVYAGSAQFISVAMIASGAVMMSIIMTTFLVNLRHLLMSASLSPFLKHIPSKAQALISYGITDETYAVAITQVSQQKMSGRYFAGLHITSQLGWVISTVVGGLLGGMMPNPTRWGIDFALSAMFIALLIMQIDNKKKVLVSICAAGISILIAMSLKGNWHIIISAVLGATIGVIIESWSKK